MFWISDYFVRIENNKINESVILIKHSRAVCGSVKYRLMFTHGLASPSDLLFFVEFICFSFSVSATIYLKYHILQFVLFKFLNKEAIWDICVRFNLNIKI